MIKADRGRYHAGSGFLRSGGGYEVNEDAHEAFAGSWGLRGLSSPFPPHRETLANATEFLRPARDIARGRPRSLCVAG